MDGILASGIVDACLLGDICIRHPASPFNFPSALIVGMLVEEGGFISGARREP